MAPSESAKQCISDAEGGSLNAQTQLGAWHLLGLEGLEQDQVKGVALVRTAADRGLAVAELVLGRCYCFGEGVEQNNPLAVALWRKAADQPDS